MMQSGSSCVAFLMPHFFLKGWLERWLFSLADIEGICSFLDPLVNIMDESLDYVSCLDELKAIDKPTGFIITIFKIFYIMLSAPFLCRKPFHVLTGRPLLHLWL